jgi:hypothetical protein
MKSVRVLAVAGLILAGSLAVMAQTSPDLEQGIKSYGSYHGGSLDHISLSNGNLFFQAGLLSYPQRGGELAYPIVLRYNNENYTIYTLQPGCPKCTTQYYAVFSADPQTPQNSLGAAVSIGFEGLPSLLGTEASTGLSLNGQPISINLYSVLNPDGAQNQIVNAGSAWVATDGSGFRTDSTLRLRRP